MALFKKPYKSSVRAIMERRAKNRKESGRVAELEHRLKVFEDYHFKILDYKAELENILIPICATLEVEHFGMAKAAVGALKQQLIEAGTIEQELLEKCDEFEGQVRQTYEMLKEKEKEVERWKENVGDLETLLSEFRNGTEYKRATDEIERLRKLLVSPCSRIHHWDGTKKCVFCEVRRLRGVLKEIAHTTVLFDPFPALKKIQNILEQEEGRE